MKNEFNKYRKNNLGAALVEFAIVSSLLIFIFFSIISYGIALYNSILIEQATKIAARSGVVSALTKNGFSSTPPFCEAVFSEIEGTSYSSESTASCVAYNFLTNKLINFDKDELPIISSASFPSGFNPKPNCYLKVRVEFYNSGIFVFNKLKSTAETIMYYE